MYTAVRFTRNPGCTDTLIDVVTAMNAIRTRVYSGLRTAGDGFSCEVCDSTQWSEHRREILRFIAKFDTFIRDAIQGGASVTADVAIETEGREPSKAIFVLRWDHDLLAAAAPEPRAPRPR